MAPTANQILSRVFKAIDEHWWLRHGLFWVVRAALMQWLFLYDLHTTTDWRQALRDVLLLLPTSMLITYTLLYGVLPLLWQEGKIKQFGLLLVAWFVGALAVNFAHRYFIFIPLHQQEASPFPDYHVVFATGAHMPLLLTSGVAACLRVYRQWRQKELDNTQLTQGNYQAELQLLKAQIHPHFLFNTLNTLYALTLRQSSQAPAVVERLTGLLHFMVKQGDAPLVTLRDEVTLLRNYMALEKLRYGSRLTLEFEANGIPDTRQIAPLLLLPLVENAFKHGSAEQLGQAHIQVKLAVEGRQFTCIVSNSKNPEPTAVAEAKGIGLRNVRQRLQLLYPQKHQFAIEVLPDVFTVRLTLQLPEQEASPLRRPQPERLSEPAEAYTAALPAKSDSLLGI